MKLPSNRLQREIEESKDLSPSVKKDIIDFINSTKGIENSIKTAKALVFRTRFISAFEMPINTPSFFINLLGYNENEKSDFSWTDFFNSLHPEDTVEFRKMMDYFINNKGGVYSGVFRMRHKSGEYIWIYGKAVRENSDDSNEKPLITGILIDFFDKNNTPHQLEALNKDFIRLKNKPS
jgi:hypothetical protein